MLTIETEEYRRALHLSRLIPLGKKRDAAKKEAVRKWREAVKNMLAHNAEK